MGIVDRWIYLDHAAVAPLPRPTADAVQAWASDVRDHGVVHWPVWRDRVEQARLLGARLLNAAPEEVAVIRNTTEGIAAVADGWHWKPGDSVVVPESEFPSNQFPWMNLRSRSVDVRIVPVSPFADNDRFCEAIRDACDQTTRIVSCSLVDYASGRRRDVRRISRIAQGCGARLFVDAIQGLAVLPVDVRDQGIDFLAADGHKWMLGPEGAGLLFIRRDRLNELNMAGPGWNSVVQAGQYSDKTLNLKNSASRYEAGTYNMGAIAGLHASLSLLSQLPRAVMMERLLAVRAWFQEAGERQGLLTDAVAVEEQSGIVAFRTAPHDPRRLMKALRQARIVCNVREGCLRISPHLYNTVDEAQEFSEALSTVQRQLAG